MTAKKRFYWGAKLILGIAGENSRSIHAYGPAAAQRGSRNPETTPVRRRVAPARLSWRPCPCFAPILDPPQAVALRDSRSNLEEGGGGSEVQVPG